MTPASPPELIISRCNERENLAMRFRKFDISALVKAAVKAAGDGAMSCKNFFSMPGKA